MAVALEFFFRFTLVPFGIIIELFPVLVICFMIGIAEELAERLEKVGEITDPEKPMIKFKKLMKTKKICQKVACQKDGNIKKLTECIEIHLKLKNIAAVVSNIFGKIFLMEGLLSVVELCTASFAMTVVRK